MNFSTIKIHFEISKCVKFYIKLNICFSVMWFTVCTEITEIFLSYLAIFLLQSCIHQRGASVGCCCWNWTWHWPLTLQRKCCWWGFCHQKWGPALWSQWLHAWSTYQGRTTFWWLGKLLLKIVLNCMLDCYYIQLSDGPGIASIRNKVGTLVFPGYFVSYFHVFGTAQVKVN